MGSLLKIANAQSEIHHASVDIRHAQHTHSLNLEKENGKEIHIHFRPNNPAWSIRELIKHNPRSLVLTSTTLPDMRLMAHRFGIDDPLHASISPPINLKEQVF